MEPTRIFDLLDRYKNEYKNLQIALAGKVNGNWKTYTAKEFVETATNFSYGLLALGLNKGDKIGIITNNRPEWNFTDMGIQMTGMINIPIYPTISEDDLRFIINDAEVKMFLVSSNEMYQKVSKIAQDFPTIQAIYTFDVVAGAKNFSEIVNLGRENPNSSKVEEIKNSIVPNDMCTILYTSGTTGNPKGVMLSHDNFLSNVLTVYDRVPAVMGKSKCLSFLPINHVYERMLTYLYQYLGLEIWYAESLETIGDNLKEVKPDVFSTVPRLLEKVYDKIVGKGKELTGVKKMLFFWALELGLKYEMHGANGWWYEFQLKLANKIIFSKWREALGGNVKGIVSGGAALQPRLARVFWAANIPVLEGYGLTETSPVVGVNDCMTGRVKFGTIGPVLPKQEVKIAEDGEILVKGPNIMLGYYKRPDLTAEVIDADGFFHTGDIGEFVDKIYLKITDRKKEIFKTSGGKYIAPQIIENKLKESVFIEQVMVVGENKNYAAALVVPSFDFLKNWCAKKDIPFTTPHEMVKNQMVMERLMEEVETVNAKLAKFETIKKIHLLPELFSIEKGEMTPKLSLRRKQILKNNEAAIEKMYD